MTEPRKITITAGEVSIEAELNDSPAAAAVYAALPIEAPASTWGEEIFFEYPVSPAGGEDAREDVEVGELGYWPPGSAFCVFFGRTPASDASGRPRAASAVVPLGRVLGDATVLGAVRAGERIVLDRAG